MLYVHLTVYIEERSDGSNRQIEGRSLPAAARALTKLEKNEILQAFLNNLLKTILISTLTSKWADWLEF